VTEELEDWKHLNYPVPPDAPGGDGTGKADREEGDEREDTGEREERDEREERGGDEDRERDNDDAMEGITPDPKETEGT
jgi:hypothetical protein